MATCPPGTEGPASAVDEGGGGELGTADREGHDRQRRQREKVIEVGMDMSHDVFDYVAAPHGWSSAFTLSAAPVVV